MEYQILGSCTQGWFFFTLTIQFDYDYRADGFLRLLQRGLILKSVCAWTWLDAVGVSTSLLVLRCSPLQMGLQSGVGLGLLYNMPPDLSIPCSVPPFVYAHLSQVHGHVIQPSHSWSSSSSCCIQLSVQHLFLGLRCLAFFLYDQAIVFFGI